MQRRLVLSTILVATIVVLLLAAPVTVVLRQAATDELEARTSAVGGTVAAAIEDRAVPGDDGQSTDIGLTADEVSLLLPDDVGVRILDRDGNEVVAVDVDEIDSPFRRRSQLTGTSTILRCNTAVLTIISVGQPNVISDMSSDLMSEASMARNGPRSVTST